MNENIKKLSNIAWNYANRNCRNIDEFSYLYSDKFSNLIIEECVAQGNILASHYIDTQSERDQVMLIASICDYSSEIKKHFGVKDD